MAFSRVETTVVDVGQGQCTFTRIYDDSTPPELVHTLLFDCGTDKSSPTTDSNIQWIADSLQLMDTPTIDLLVFSHSDNDHISLMYDLINAYKGKKKLKILSTWYAGDPDFYTKNTFNILDYLTSYCKSFTTPDFNESQYDSSKHGWDTPPMWISADKTVQVSMLMGNVIDNQPGIFKLTAFGKVAEKKNRVSIVCALMHGTRTLLICGDATNRTMAWTNYYFGTDSFTNALMITLPHHGSRSTGLNVSSAQVANKKSIDVVKTFATLASAKTLTVSAYALHGHPSIDLINYFSPTTVSTATLKDTRLSDDSHFTVCNVDVPLHLSTTLAKVTEDYHTLNSETNLFATYYYSEVAKFSYQFKAVSMSAPAKFKATKAPAINPHACWVYTTTTGGGNTVRGYKAMPATSTSKFTSDGTVPETVSGGAKGAFVTNEDRPLPPHPSELFPSPPEDLPDRHASRSSTRAATASAAWSLARMRTFR
ncbi:MAG TPA: hypothetical protein VGV14_18045 [Rhodanobacter sp.]|nr:hypothetical protein [Rhodanobacter sp.]